MLFSKILGVKFTNASTDASVYFPACGEVDSSLLSGIGFCGSYWSSSIYDTAGAWGFILDHGGVSTNYGGSSYLGLCVRAVK
jgi:hypothetical protein